MKYNHPIRIAYNNHKESFYGRSIYWLIFRSLSYKEKHQKKIVVFYPELPRPRFILGRIFRILRYQITTDLQAAEKAAFVVNWENTTFRRQIPELVNLSASRFVINIGCLDISKKQVDATFGKVFGYQTRIDPTTYQGMCVKKGDINALHNGTIINCPILYPEDGFIYQKLVNNQVGTSVVEDLRVPVFLTDIPFVYVKNRPVESRFANKNTKCTIAPTHQVLSQTEVGKIIDFCKLMRLDYGELDVLRDREDNKIYIVDVNNTPIGPPGGISFLDKIRALHKLSAAFIKNFIEETPALPLKMELLQKEAITID
jgi:hypothetical protein